VKPLKHRHKVGKESGVFAGVLMVFLKRVTGPRTSPTVAKGVYEFGIKSSLTNRQPRKGGHMVRSEALLRRFFHKESASEGPPASRIRWLEPESEASLTP